MLSPAGNAVGAWLFFTIGVSPAAVLAGVTFTWAALRASLSPPTQWLTSRRTTMKRYFLAICAVIAAAGLAGCAGHSDLQFFKAYGAGQVEQRYLGMNIIAVSQSDRSPSVPK
jgi:hypothetical protein